MNLDMTKGSPLKLMLKFVFPIIIGNIFQQFYNMVDTIIVGRYVGVTALAAVGATGTINFLILGFAMGLTSGFTVVTAQKFGACDYEGLKKSVGSGALLSVIVTVVLTALSVAFMHPLLRLLNTPDDIYEMSYQYIIIICIGLFAVVLYNLMASYLRAVGNSIVPLVFLIISAVLNIFLDLFFIINFHMGVVGAALATVLSQAISGVACLVYVSKKVPVLCINRSHIKLHKGYVRNQIGIGLPMALQFSITAIGTLILQGALNLFGSVIIAAYTTACKAEQLLTQPFPAIGATMATYAAQNYGIYDIKRIRKGVRAACLITVVYALAIAFAANYVSAPIMSLFVTENVGEMITYGKIYIFIVSLFFAPLGLIFVFRNVMQGMGYGIMPMLAGVMELIGRGVGSVIAGNLMSYEGICYATVSAWILADVLLIPAYFSVMRKIKE